MKKLILVAQETSDARKGVLNALSPLYTEGYSILTCMSGEELIKKMYLGQACLVVVDLTMPELNGFELINRLASDPSTSSVPIMVLTPPTLGIFKYITRCMGVTYFFNRPTSPVKILEMARECMGRKE
ncbi:MAG: response regulator [Caldisericales bacterium]|nr:response regulator [Caldisericales bacterium]